MVSDGEGVSMSKLLRAITPALERSAWPFAVPVLLIRAGATLLRERELAQRRSGSLRADISHGRASLHWSRLAGFGRALPETVSASRKR